MDRNLAGTADSGPLGVALRKESVDRNQFWSPPLQHKFRSLSARRAWIEISEARKSAMLAGVALRKESVDRNIRIADNIPCNCVALRKESVDRNCIYAAELLYLRSRSPQGERG